MARLYQQGRRWWGDFREFRTVGGAREPLIPDGQSLASLDVNLAAQLFAARLKNLEDARDDVARGRPAPMTLGDFAREHIAAKREAGKVTQDWLELQAVFLDRALAFLGEGRRLTAISVEDVKRWIAHLRKQPAKGSSRPLSEGTIRHHLNALSNLYRRAKESEAVPPGFNPVAALLEKPVGRTLEAAWLEVPDAALLLESARRLPRLQVPNELPFVYELVATLLLTGGRLSEVLGLEMEDVNFERQTITIRPNAWRRVKTKGSARSVPLWPQLEGILRSYLEQRVAAAGPDRPARGERPDVLSLTARLARTGQAAPAGQLLFPAPIRGPERMLGDIQKTLDRVAIQAGFREPVMDQAGEKQRKDKQGRLMWRGTIRSKMFRHTYCAARLQTLDQGAPVSVYTVAHELGHGSETMVKRVYGHLGQVRHRAEVVEYRVEQHRARLGDRLKALPSEAVA